MLSAERIALLKHGAPPRNALEAALRNVWYGGGASYEKTVGPAPIISISDAKAKPAVSLIASMSPVQDLHGQTSPYPPGGGVNLLDPSKTSVFGSDSSHYGIHVEFDSATEMWSFSGTSTSTSVSSAFSFLSYSDASLSGKSYFIQAFDVSGTGSVCFKSVYGFRTESETDCAIVFDFSSVQSINITLKISVSATSQTAWSPYSNECPITGRTGVTVDHSGADTSDPQTYHVMFPDGQTVYGGTVDVVSGVLTVTDAEIASYNGETLPSTWISDRDVYAEGTTPTIGAQVVYELATPQTFQLTPQQIQMLKGANVLWSDADDLTLTYIGTTPANLLGGMLGLGNTQEPIEETSEESVEEPVSDEPTEGDGE